MRCNDGASNLRFRCRIPALGRQSGEAASGPHRGGSRHSQRMGAVGHTPWANARPNFGAASPVGHARDRGAVPLGGGVRSQIEPAWRPLQRRRSARYPDVRLYHLPRRWHRSCAREHELLRPGEQAAFSRCSRPFSSPCESRAHTCPGPDQQWSARAVKRSALLSSIPGRR